jgi:hypothetical protein
MHVNEPDSYRIVGYPTVLGYVITERVGMRRTGHAAYQTLQVCFAGIASAFCRSA